MTDESRKDLEHDAAIVSIECRWIYLNMEDFEHVGRWENEGADVIERKKKRFNVIIDALWSAIKHAERYQENLEKLEGKR